MDFFPSLFLALLSTLLLQSRLCYALNFRYKFCTAGANYTANSTFQANRNVLLSSISDEATRNNTRFYNTSAGKTPDSVYGLFQCRGDYGIEDCKIFAVTASEHIKTLCPYKKEATLIYDECWIQYSDKSISSLQLDPTGYLWNVNNVSSDQLLFSQKRAELMNRLVVQAVSNSSNLFAVGEVNLTSFDKIYGLVQCTEDLSRSDCNRCLRVAVSELPRCCDRSLGGRSMKPSCIARFESSEFFETNSVIPPPASPGRNNTTGKENKSRSNIVLIVVATVSAAVVLLITTFYFFLKKKKGFEIAEGVDQATSAESLQMKFATVAAATEYFSEDNRLGEGGFGAVYKGKLSGGQEVAVKRLFRNSGQGVEEFKNEVLLLAKLQHKNLVRLLGFCVEEDERLIIYEFVPNASLDLFLLDEPKHAHLDWEKRYNVIGGVARGLLYLHEDSRQTVIHRDLKASNVLLDASMNPKIADFGLARLVAVDQTHGITKTLFGTDGYMAPEYARQGHFSTKTDVFSFGVLVLEIISGQKNKKSYESEFSENLLSKAWRQWENGTALELLDPTLGEHYSRNEVMRCIHIGLICVQEDPARRPTIASILLMLDSYSVTVPLPSAPASFSSTPIQYLLQRRPSSD